MQTRSSALEIRAAAVTLASDAAQFLDRHEDRQAFKAQAAQIRRDVSAERQRLQSHQVGGRIEDPNQIEMF